MKKDLVARVSIGVVFLIIGIVSTLLYVYYSNHIESFYNAGEAGRKENYIPVTKDKAQELMANYVKDQDRVWPEHLSLRTGKDKQRLRGFWIDAKLLKDVSDSLEVNHPGTVISGYNVFLAKWDTAQLRFYSLVVRATGAMNSERRPGGIGNYFDMVDPCPDQCGNDGK